LAGILNGLEGIKMSENNFLKTIDFPEVRQIGIVVKNIDQAVKYYSRFFGIGPWFKPRFSEVEHSLKGEERIDDEVDIAIAFSGKIQLELIEPVTGNKSIYWDHLKDHGDGIHHLGYYVSDIEKRLNALAEKKIGVLQSGSIHSTGKVGGSLTTYAYLDTKKIGGTILELIQTKCLGFNIQMSRFWFELGSLTGDVEKIKI
jgi:catechol 2,3-dioxygenase-like lactoylglutathione lyase family enzyme